MSPYSRSCPPLPLASLRDGVCGEWSGTKDVAGELYAEAEAEAGAEAEAEAGAEKGGKVELDVPTEDEERLSRARARALGDVRSTP